MRSLADVADQALVWHQTARLKRNFELRAGDEVVATLRFQRGTLADAEVANMRWTFKREGFWHRRVVIRLPGSDADSGAVQLSWRGGGTLALPDGRTVRLAAANVWRSEWIWGENHDAPLVRFESRQGFMRLEGHVDVLGRALKPEELALLVMLGWYLIVLNAEDSAAASASATVVAGGG